MTALYTTKELEAIADGMGQIGVNKMRKALRWAARTLEAADAAVQAECLRATQASATEREACAKAMDDLAEDYKAASRRDDKRNLSLEADKWNQRVIAFRDAAAAIRARSKT